MVSKTIFNILYAFVVFQALLIWKDWGNLLTGNYYYFDIKFNNMWEYIRFLSHENGYPIPSIIAVLVVQLPYNFILYRLEKGFSIPLLKKIGIATGLYTGLILLLGTFINIWVIPYYRNLVYLFYAFILGLIYASLQYVLIDRRQKR